MFLRIAQYFLAAMGLVALVYWAVVFFDARYFQVRTLHTFDNRLPSPPATIREAPPAIREAPPEGSIVAKLAIPRLGLESMVVEGVDAKDLRRGPGHIPGTPLPGEGGNVGIAGHRDGFFRPLRAIRKDDLIQVTTSRGEDEYKVVYTEIVTPSDVQVLYPTGGDSLTLVTCYPFSYIGAAPNRFIVRAERFARLPSESRPRQGVRRPTRYDAPSTDLAFE
jgi:sortase A